MKRRNLLLILIAVLVLTGWFWFNRNQEFPAPIDTPQTQKEPSVEIGFVSDTDPESSLDLSGSVWTWHALLVNNTNLEIASPEAFKLTFTSDQTFSSATDCNTLNGFYRSTHGSAIKFSNIASTKMYCESSQEDIYKSVLSAVESYSLTANELSLYAPGANSIITFRREL